MPKGAGVGSAKASPGSDIPEMDSIPVHRVPGGTNFGIEIDPQDLRDNNGGVDGWMSGVKDTPKPPRTDPETYNYKVDRNSRGYPGNVNETGPNSSRDPRPTQEK